MKQVLSYFAALGAATVLLCAVAGNAESSCNWSVVCPDILCEGTAECSQGDPLGSISTCSMSGNLCCECTGVKYQCGTVPGCNPPQAYIYTNKRSFENRICSVGSCAPTP